jgi:hypothetical protein
LALIFSEEKSGVEMVGATAIKLQHYAKILYVMAHDAPRHVSDMAQLCLSIWRRGGGLAAERTRFVLPPLFELPKVVGELPGALPAPAVAGGLALDFHVARVGLQGLVLPFVQRRLVAVVSVGGEVRQGPRDAVHVVLDDGQHVEVEVVSHC